MCLGWDSNPYRHFCPRDFLATMAFATVCLWSGLFLHHNLRLRCVVSSLCTFLIYEAWLKITIGIIR